MCVSLPICRFVSRAAALAAALLALFGAGSVAAETRAVSGTLLVVQEDDFGGGTSEVHLWIATADESRPIPLDTTQELLGTAAGTRLRVLGQWDGESLRVEDVSRDVDVLSLPAALALVERRVLVLVVDFSDSAVSCTDTAVRDLMFDGIRSVDGLYRETSFGDLALPGDTDQDGTSDVLRVQIGAQVSGSACDPVAWGQAADAAAVAAGFDLGLYQHRLYVLPSNTSCAWAGLAYVGCGSSCRAWVETCSLPDVYAHELGHNLGLRHASTDDNDDGVADCEYCDRSDFMGIGGVGWRQVNGPHKLQAGWLPQGAVTEIADVGEREITLAALEQDPGSTALAQLVRIERPGASHVYLSYRTRSGYDDALHGSYADQTSVHSQPAGSGGNTLLLENLADGEEFADPTADLSVVQLSHGADSVTLRIRLGCSGGGCGGEAPGTVTDLHRTDTDE